MNISNSLSELNINDDSIEAPNFQYINVFKNPNKLPITQVHLEKKWRQLRKKLPEDLDIINCSGKDLQAAYLEEKTEIIPALDKRWLPKGSLSQWVPFSIHQKDEENVTFLAKNIVYLQGLEYLLNCDFHQFWCLVLYEPSVTVSLRSFLLNPVLPFQFKYLERDNLQLFKAVFNKFLLVYEKLITFKKSEYEYMPNSFGLSKIIEKKLLNLPIVITLAVVYSHSKLEFVNKIVDIYFNNTTEMDFLIKEVETVIEQNCMVLEILCDQICGTKGSDSVPISILNRPPIFSLNWVYSVGDYLVSTLLTLNALFHFYKPALELALVKELPYRLPYTYVNIYREIYELLDDREETQTNTTLFGATIDVINVGRREFVELFHSFISKCLDDAFQYMDNESKQEGVVETYMSLLTTALEEDYFICDYDATYKVTTQNEILASCCQMLDTTRTDFIVSCIKKLPRNKKLQELSKLNRQTLENVFKDFKPPYEPEYFQPDLEAGTSTAQNDSDIEEMIRGIVDMFPHLGDGYIYQCLESYNFNSSDVINAILENNLPPHLAEIPFDTIRIPPEPEPEQPILAYKGKKPDYNDALTLLNDKTDIQSIKKKVLEGIQYSTDYLYDDEYDDRFNDDVSLPVADDPLNGELKIFNPNRQSKKQEESESEEEPSESENASSDRNRLNFCEDPAVLRERREARYRQRNPRAGNGQEKPKNDVVGKPKGQGQEKSTQLNRQKKSVNKSSRANHNRKGGATWKRSRGMIPS
ncbi:activating signal cointegrator 1 complex subunit 2 [Anthonomus grandis grandis]|uniref:activating signal cointegrator 1 complex subunit 2 n=1 Tax=Anthonomus grandis grandis TaxID=2921223 RepID=UPI002166ADF0|nr:activating signal cointegrator 1 complex subunit 2 [Anthonomus grandis grandis]